MGKAEIALAMLLAASVLAGILMLGPPTAVAADRDCGDFSSQKQAQAFFDENRPGDPHNLDGDGDGRACEDLPCPCAEPGDGGNGDSVGPQRARVVSVTDGDTIKVRIRRRTRDVRLIGIDTPEVEGRGECGGSRATRAMKRLLDRGDRVRLIPDPTQDARDQYGRLLRYVEKSGRDVGKRQVRDGWAMTYVFEAPFKRLSPYRDAERQADSANRGVWGRCGGDFHKAL